MLGNRLHSAFMRVLFIITINLKITIHIISCLKLRQVSSAQTCCWFLIWLNWGLCVKPLERSLNSSRFITKSFFPVDVSTFSTKLSQWVDSGHSGAAMCCSIIDTLAADVYCARHGIEISCGTLTVVALRKRYFYMPRCSHNIHIIIYLEWRYNLTRANIFSYVLWAISACIVSGRAT